MSENDSLKRGENTFDAIRIVKSLLPLSKEGDYIVITRDNGGYTVQTSDIPESLEDPNLERVKIEILRYKRKT
jgi:hypothetical protein